MGGLFRGAGPTVVRAMALNMGMLASNDQVGQAMAHSRGLAHATGVVAACAASAHAALCPARSQRPPPSRCTPNH